MNQTIRVNKRAKYVIRPPRREWSPENSNELILYYRVHTKWGYKWKEVDWCLFKIMGGKINNMSYYTHKALNSFDSLKELASFMAKERVRLSKRRIKEFMLNKKADQDNFLSLDGMEFPPK